MDSRIELEIDDYDLSTFSALLRQSAPGALRFIVTPNVDHVIRYCDDVEFRSFYHHADYILLDSRFLARLLILTRKLRPPVRVCLGSDLTSEIFANLLAPSDRIVIVGGSDAQAAKLRERFRLTDMCHINPPMGFVRNKAQVEDCLAAIEAASPFRYCFLAVGSPQQELLAVRLKERGRARGTALCIGASINFLTGAERRAPQWLQRLGLEWLYRLANDPGRLAKRYLVRDPRIFALLKRLEIRVRPATHRSSGDVS